MKLSKLTIFAALIVLALSGYGLAQVLPIKQKDKELILPPKPVENIYSDKFSDSKEIESALERLRAFDMAVENDKHDLFENLFTTNPRIISLDDKENALEYTPDALLRYLPARLDIEFTHTVEGDEVEHIAVNTNIHLQSEFYSEFVNAIFILPEPSIDRIAGLILSPISYEEWEMGDVVVFVTPMGTERFAFTNAWLPIAFDSERADRVLQGFSERTLDEISIDSGEYSVLVVAKKPINADSVVNVIVSSVDDSGEITNTLVDDEFEVNNFSRRAIFELALNSHQLDTSLVQIDVYINDQHISKKSINIVN